MASEFDPYAKDYDALLNSATRATGYEAGDFAEAKLKRIAQLFPEFAQSNGCLLDFGCGGGNLYEKFSDYFPQVYYIGVDPSSDMVKEARSKYEDAQFFGIESPEWKQMGYGLIVAANVFHHIPHEQHATVLSQLTDVLQPGGHLVIWEHNPANPVTRKIVKDCEFDQDAVLVPPGQLEQQFHDLSLEQIDRRYVTFFPKWLGFLSGLELALGWLPLGGQYLISGRRPFEV